MTQSEKSDMKQPVLARLNGLVDEFERLARLERELRSLKQAYYDAYEQWVETRAAEVRAARQALYMEAVRLVVINREWLPEVVTVLVHDARASSLDAVAQQLGQALTSELRDWWREHAPRSE